MQLKTKNEIFVQDLDSYYKTKQYQGELIGLYEPDTCDMERLIQNYANTKYKFLIYFEQTIPKMIKYKNFSIETNFINFYNTSEVFAVYQDEEYYMLNLKIFDTLFYSSNNN
ncbi:MAG: hypothetical protein JXR51_15610 [Bacteroidales bacterium]|nr:hypothetical protein [Bacteroidales bacterium]